MESSVKVLKADINDTWKILNLQKLAFKSEGDIYNDYSLEPLVQTIDDMKNEFEKKIFLKAVIGEEIIGSVRMQISGDVFYINRLVVHPDFQNRGIGKTLMCEAEKYSGKAKKIELFTGHKSEKNLRLYKKCGYEPYKIEVVKDDMHFVYMRKYV